MLTVTYTLMYIYFFQQIGCLVSVIVMLTMRHDAVALFTGTAFFGLFLSSSTPTALSLCEQYIDITCKYILMLSLLRNKIPY